MTTAHDDILAQALLAHHHARFDGPGILPPAPPGTGWSALRQAAWRACRALGFIDIDADCLAQAWQARAERMGRAIELDWPDDPQDFGLGRQRPEGPAFPPCPQSMGLYVVAPDARWIERLAAMGVPTLQLRYKSDDPAAVRREVRAALAAVRGSGARLFINDHWQIALEEGAWGVHLGQEDLPQADLDALRRGGLRLGVSTHGYAEMLRADRVQPSYIALGAVFPTTLKAMPTAPLGLARLQAYANLLQRQQPAYPLVAIGGIDRTRLPAVLSSGVGSVAVVRAVLGAADPEAEARALMQAMTGQAAEA